MKYNIISLLIFLTFIVGVISIDYKLIAQLQGTIPGDPTNGDLYGQAVAISSRLRAIIGAPSASPPNLDQAGALYFYEEQCENWEESQVPDVGPTAFDLESNPLIVSRDEWLFVAAAGTPLNNSYVKDFSGCVLVYRLILGKWVKVQELCNPLGPQYGAGSFFSSNLAFDGKEWLVVGGFVVNNAWFYKLNHRTKLWELKWTVTPPNRTGAPGYIFVSISNGKALIGEPVPQFQTFDSNVYAYSLTNKITGEWSLTQTISGIGNIISPQYGLGDYLGEFISMDGNWAAISAPYDSENGTLTGAVYLLHLEHNNWIHKQKIFSDKPSALFGFGLAIQGSDLTIGDCGRTVNNNIFQGAGVGYNLIEGKWVRSHKLLIDPNGRAYDWLGSGGIDLNAGIIGLGDSTYTDNYLPQGFPGKRNYPFTTQGNNGHAVLYQIIN